MSGKDNEIYKVPEGVDNSLPAMQARLLALQPSLKHLMAEALHLFDSVFEQAPHPADKGVSDKIYAVQSANFCPVENIPMGRELTVVLGAGKWLRVFRNSEGSPDTFPRQRLWYNQPEGEGSRKVNVMRTHNPARSEYPYDIETVDYDSKGSFLGDVGGGSYYMQEPFIAQAEDALDEATLIALDNGLFAPR